MSIEELKLKILELESENEILRSTVKKSSMSDAYIYNIKNCLTVQQFAEYHGGLSTSAVTHLIRTGVIDAYKVGNIYLILKTPQTMAYYPSSNRIK